ncbi:MAG TPA: hypothetical protein VGH94_09750 [Acidimicrobiales bacterium]|jgi:hypothetical protein
MTIEDRLVQAFEALDPDVRADSRAWEAIQRRRRRPWWRRIGVLMVAAAAALGGGIGATELLAPASRPSVDVATEKPNVDGPSNPADAPAPTSGAVVLRGSKEPSLPGRYVAYGRDGVVSVVTTATGEAREIYRAAPFSAHPEIAGVAVDPAARYVYVATDPDGSCVGEIVRIPVAGGQVERVAAGADPVISPDGRWLVYAVDGPTARGEKPPPVGDPDLPCRYRHDSYVWHNLVDGTEVRWTAPSPAPAKGHDAGLFPISIDSTSTRLTISVDDGPPDWDVTTRAVPDPARAQHPLGGNEELFHYLRWLPDGTLLAAPLDRTTPVPAGVRSFEPPDGYTANPIDVSSSQWLIAGYRDSDPGDYAGFTSTWAWDQSDRLIPLANNAIVKWIDGQP